VHVPHGDPARTLVPYLTSDEHHDDWSAWPRWFRACLLADLAAVPAYFPRASSSPGLTRCRRAVWVCDRPRLRAVLCQSDFCG